MIAISLKTWQTITTGWRLFIIVREKKVENTISGIVAFPIWHLVLTIRQAVLPLKVLRNSKRVWLISRLIFIIISKHAAGDKEYFLSSKRLSSRGTPVPIVAHLRSHVAANATRLVFVPTEFEQHVQGSNGQTYLAIKIVKILLLMSRNGF